MKHEPEVFSVFKKWKKEVVNQVAVKINKLKTANEEECESAEFRIFCEENSIIRQRTVVGTPQENEVAVSMRN